MKILSKLNATSQDAPDRVRRGIRLGHDVEIAPGQFLRHLITDDGLFLESGRNQIVIPLDELHALAIAHNPGFAPKGKK